MQKHFNLASWNIRSITGDNTTGSKVKELETMTKATILDITILQEVRRPTSQKERTDNRFPIWHLEGSDKGNHGVCLLTRSTEQHTTKAKIKATAPPPKQR